jgi:hypothetical protein
MGMVVICLLGTVDLIQIPYPTVYKIPIFLRTVLFILPTAVLTFFLILYLNRKNLIALNTARLSALIFVALIGIIAIGNIGSIFYYIGGAGYEYGKREIPSWIYALWGSIPTFLMLAAFYFALIKFGTHLNRREKGNL